MGISNMKDIQEMMLWNWTCVFRVPMTTVLIQITSFLKFINRLKVDASWRKLDSKSMRPEENYFDDEIVKALPDSDFEMEAAQARILQIGWFYRPKLKIECDLLGAEMKMFYIRKYALDCSAENGYLQKKRCEISS